MYRIVRKSQFLKKNGPQNGHLEKELFKDLHH